MSSNPIKTVSDATEDRLHEYALKKGANGYEVDQAVADKRLSANGEHFGGDGNSSSEPVGANTSRRPRSDHRILVLSMVYAPEPNFITQDVANFMAQTSRVTVITTFPNYPRGRFYDGRSHWLPTKSREGDVTVWRVPMYPDHSRSKLRRFLSYLSFTLSAAILAPFVGGAPDVVWVYQTPFVVGLVGLWFKLVFKSRLVFTYADLWPESFLAAAVSKPGLLVDALFRGRRAINRTADRIIGSTKGTVELFRRDGVPAHKLDFVPVWVAGIPSAPAAESTRSASRIVYAGNLGPGQHLEPVIEAAAEIERRGVPVHFDIYGSGLDEERLRDLAVLRGLGNMTFHGRVSPEEAFRVSSAALAQLVTLRPDPMFEMTIPSKLPFCFAAGTPVLYSLRGEAAAVAAESGAALAFDAENPNTLAERIDELLNLAPHERAALGNRLRQYYHSEFSTTQLLERYDAILGPQPRQVPAEAES